MAKSKSQTFPKQTEVDIFVAFIKSNIQFIDTHFMIADIEVRRKWTDSKYLITITKISENGTTE